MSVPSQAIQCEEDKALNESLEEWDTVETSDSLFDEDDTIFHPDDEIIEDPKESSEVLIKRVSNVLYYSLMIGEHWIPGTWTRMASSRSFVKSCASNRPTLSSASHWTA